MACHSSRSEVGGPPGRVWLTGGKGLTSRQMLFVAAVKCAGNVTSHISQWWRLTGSGGHTPRDLTVHQSGAREWWCIKKLLFTFLLKLFKRKQPSERVFPTDTGNKTKLILQKSYQKESWPLQNIGYNGNKLKNKAVPSELGHHSALLSTSDSEVIAESYS